MEYLIGIDGGGTKTSGVIADTEGHIVAEATAGPTNYQVRGIASATDEIKSLVLELLDKADANPSSIEKIVAGLAGVGRTSDEERLKSHFRKELPTQLADTIYVTTDLHIALFGALKDEVGLIVNAGTGAVTMGRGSNGDIKRADGWGYLLGDEGSGYWIGLQAIKRSLKFHDGRASRTSLKEKLMEHYSLEDFEEIIPLVYDESENSLTKSIANLAPLVFQEARENDEVARNILSEAGRKLGRTAAAVIDRLKINYGQVKVVLMGGVFSSQQKGLLLENFEEEISDSISDWSYLEPKHSPKVGALFMGCDLLGEEIFDPKRER